MALWKRMIIFAARHGMAALLAVSSCLPVPALSGTAEAKACPAAVRRQILSPPPADGPFELACDLSLEAGDTVRVPLALSGLAASGITLDCKGAALAGAAAGMPALAIRSVRRDDGSWDAPRDIAISNCVIRGALRIIGLGRNGEAEWVQRSSLQPGHTERAQAAAPSRIRLDRLRFIADGDIPLYLGPGTTKVELVNSRLEGRTNSVAVYLDAESAENEISGNDFSIVTKSREMIALDGSARNTITGNIFENPVNGGVFLYRNCGEGGTIRHQAPQGNVIAGNVFRYGASAADAKPAVWLGSRQGGRSYCFVDAAHPFGSSLNPRDNAQFNTVTGNSLPGGNPSLILDDDADNRVSGNR
ncbi:right-handed parallel beta-helix repeat-containing protein [Rhizobium binxianense]